MVVVLTFSDKSVTQYVGLGKEKAGATQDPCLLEDMSILTC